MPPDWLVVLARDGIWLGMFRPLLASRHCNKLLLAYTGRPGKARNDEVAQKKVSYSATKTQLGSVPAGDYRIGVMGSQQRSGQQWYDNDNGY
jgi:hypothetical protein